MIDKILTYRFMDEYNKWINRVTLGIDIAFGLFYLVVRTRLMAEILLVVWGLHLLMQLGYIVLSNPTIKRERERKRIEVEAELARYQQEEFEFFRRERENRGTV